MDMGLQDKVAIVGGASRGLGKGCALGLAREGAIVAICARNGERLVAVAEEIRQATGASVLTVVGDLANEETVAALVEQTVQEFGGIDILVNNSGGPDARPFAEIAEDEWRAYIDLMLMYVVRMCRYAIPVMQERGGGRIINLTAFAVKQPLGNTASNVLRTAVIGLAKTLANECAGDKILVNNVCTGFIDTELLRDEFAEAGHKQGISTQEAMDDFAAAIPLGRLGTVEELTNYVVFLASERASYITGTSLQVDGGFVQSLL